ncbi:tail fiber assembly protein [Aeromonas veronii]
MEYIKLNERGFADESGYLRCHICHPETGEYTGQSDEFISQHTGLPAWAFLEGPTREPKSGHVWVHSPETASWLEVEDHRGITVYDTVTKERSDITELGPIPDGKTDLTPASPHDKWSGTAWVTDEAAEQQATLEAAMGEQTQRIAMATQQIVILTPAVDGGYAKPEHTQLLADWQRCRYELTLVPEQLGWPEKPQWPAEPEKVI